MWTGTLIFFAAAAAAKTRVPMLDGFFFNRTQFWSYAKRQDFRYE